MCSTYEKMQLCFQDSTRLPDLAADPDWRVRYSAAVAMGEFRDAFWLPELERMFALEEARPLYTQPNIDTADSTRLSEKIGPLPDPFAGSNYTEEEKEAWKCRGRVKTAIADAVGKIGEMSPVMQEYFEHCLDDEEEDYSVKAAVARALGNAGTKESIPALERTISYDEWCTKTEAQKAVRKIKERNCP